MRTAFLPDPVPDLLVNQILDVGSWSPVEPEESAPCRFIVIREQAKKKALAELARDFVDFVQKDSARFREVLSQYPRWLRFSNAEADGLGDGVQALGMPRIAKLGFGVRAGPVLGKLGLMNAESRPYAKNVATAPVVMGTALDTEALPGRAHFDPMLTMGGVLQNFRLKANSLGLAYQDAGWITATPAHQERARRILDLSERFIPMNFARIGYEDPKGKPSKRSNFRRTLSEIAHLERYWPEGSRPTPRWLGEGDPETSISITPIERAIDRTRSRARSFAPKAISDVEVRTLLEAARWAPSGFNTQPWAFVAIRDSDQKRVLGRASGRLKQEDPLLVAILHDHDRPDPDPGPCEVLAMGAVTQNVCLAASALGLAYQHVEFGGRAEEEHAVRACLGIPDHYAVTAVIRIGYPADGWNASQ